MKAVAEPLEGNKVKLSVEVDEAEFDKAVDAAFRRLAREVKVDGFRPGKAPRRVLEAKLGAGVAREEAIREALPEYYENALRETDTDAIAQPEIDITSGEAGPLQFDAVVEIRPVITVPGYDSLRVVVPNPEPTEEEITQQIDRLRNQGAELNDVERACREGDAVVIDIHGTQNDEAVAGLDATDLTYEVGSGSLVDGLDGRARRREGGRRRHLHRRGTRPRRRRRLQGARQGGQGKEAARGHRRVGERGVRVRHRRRAQGRSRSLASPRSARPTRK